MFGTPVVDVFYCGRIAEIQTFHPSHVMVCHGADKLRTQPICLVDGNIVGNAYRGLLIQSVGSLQDILIERVEVVDVDTLTADSFKDFLLADTISTVSQHSHEVCYAQW